MVHISTISRLLRKNKWSRKELRRISLNRSNELRQRYREEMSQFAADDLIFLDESIFNEKTGWRYQGYAPIGDEARYHADVRRGATWSIVAAMTVNGWLSCTGIKQGYYNKEQFLDWLKNDLLATLRCEYRDKSLIIVLDNLSVHVDPRVQQMIKAENHLIRYLPSYSPDYNSIELTFSVLKA